MNSGPFHQPISLSEKYPMRSGLPRYGATASEAALRNSRISAGSNGSVQTKLTVRPSSSSGVLGKPISAAGSDHAPAGLNPHPRRRRRVAAAHSARLSANRSQRYARGRSSGSPAPPSTPFTPNEKNGSPHGVSRTGPAAEPPIDQRDD